MAGLGAPTKEKKNKEQNKTVLCPTLLAQLSYMGGGGNSAGSAELAGTHVEALG